MEDHNQIKLFSEPLDFFRKLVTKAIENQNALVNQEVEFYLVSLLVQFMQTQKMQRSQEDPLAIKLHKAMVSGKVERMHLLKEMGDFSLYICGFFSDSLKRKLVDIDYYMAMGEAAYQRLSYDFSQEALQTLYNDLCNRFGTYVDILAGVSDAAFSHTNQDVLRIYEKWLKTRSARLAALLKKEGLFLKPDLHKNIH